MRPPTEFPGPALATVRRREVTDGLSNTLQLGEQDSEAEDPQICWWYVAGAMCRLPPNTRGQDGLKLKEVFRSRHPGGGANFLLADDSVRFVPDTISETVYRHLSTINGGEVIEQW
jgi:prepilin-type processing-associated H-X9-DG protein